MLNNCYLSKNLNISANISVSFTEILYPFSVGAGSELHVGFNVGKFEVIWRTSKVCHHLLCHRSSVHLPE
jgi:hypothetical protein